MMAKKPDERFQTAGDVAVRLTEWLAERGRTPGGGEISGAEHGSGVGSGVFSRFALGMPTPTPGVGVGSSGSGGPTSQADRDTTRLNETGGSPATDEEIGLAPLDEEADEKQRRSGSANLDDELITASDVALEKRLSASGSGSKKSLVEEELHDPEVEAIKRKVAQRAHFNPLKPVGYNAPSSGPNWAIWLLGGLAVVVVIVILVLVLRG